MWTEPKGEKNKYIILVGEVNILLSTIERLDKKSAGIQDATLPSTNIINTQQLIQHSTQQQNTHFFNFQQNIC
jgi:hypothetical protein